MDTGFVSAAAPAERRESSLGWGMVLPTILTAVGSSLFTASWLGLLGDGPDLGAAQTGVVGVWIPGALAAAFAFATLHPRVARRGSLPVTLGLLIGVAVPYAIAILLTAAANIERVPGWDIGGFIILGQAAARGTPYDVEFYRQAALAYPVPTQSFVDELTPWYPPQAFLLFLPLGWAASLSTAAALWYAIQLTAVVGAILLIWRTFLADVEWTGLPLAAVLVLSFWPTLSMVNYGQSDALLLCAAVLLVATQTRPIGGLWLALGTIVKPLFLILVLAPLVRRHWAMLGVAGLTFLIPTLVATALFGVQGMSGFVDQLGTLGTYRFTQTANTSISGLLTRLPFAERGPGGLAAAPFGNPWFLGIGLALTVVSVHLIDRRERVTWTMAIALVVPVALLVYPGSLVHYAMLQLVTLLAVWRERAALRVGPALMAVLTLGTFAGSGLDAGRLAAYTSLGLWLLVVGLILRMIRSEDRNALAESPEAVPVVAGRAPA
jgi:hypothetical protein